MSAGMHDAFNESFAVRALDWFCDQCQSGPGKVVYAREVAAIVGYMLDNLQNIAELAYDAHTMPKRYQQVAMLIDVLGKLASPVTLVGNSFEQPHDEGAKLLLDHLGHESLGLPDFDQAVQVYTSNKQSKQSTQLGDLDISGDSNDARYYRHVDGNQDDYNVHKAEHEVSNNNNSTKLPVLAEKDATGKPLWYLSIFTIPRGRTRLARELANLIECINVWWRTQRGSLRDFSMFIHRVKGNPVYVALKSNSTERDFPRIELAKFLRDFYFIDLGWLSDDTPSSYGRAVVEYSNNKTSTDFSDKTISAVLCGVGKKASMGCMIFPTVEHIIVGAPSQELCDRIVAAINKVMERRGPRHAILNTRSNNKLVKTC